MADETTYLPESDTTSSDEASVSHVVIASEVEGYIPTFSEKVRTAVYILCLVASIVGLGFMSFGDAAVGGFVSTAAGILASGTGTAYNPISLKNR